MLILKSLFILFFIATTLFSSQYVIVDLSEQIAYALEDGDIVFEGRISSGKSGHETPEGDFTVLQKNAITRLIYGLSQKVEQRCRTCYV